MGTSRAALRLQPNGAAIGAALEEACVHGPAHGRFCILRSLFPIREAGQIAFYCHIVAFVLSIAIQKHRHLLSGNRHIGKELGLRHPADNSILTGPGHRVRIEAIFRHICKGMLHTGHLGGTLHPVQNGRQLPPGQVHLGCKPGLGHTDHPSSLRHFLYGIIVPNARLHILKRNGEGRNGQLQRFAGSRKGFAILLHLQDQAGSLADLGRLIAECELRHQTVHHTGIGITHRQRTVTGGLTVKYPAIAHII